MADRNRERSTLDGVLRKQKQEEVSLSIFAFMFSEFVQYTQLKIKTPAEWEDRLAAAGRNVGLRLLELTCFREKIVKRETKIVAMLSFIHSWIWKALFGRSADSLEKSTEHDDEYMIIDNKALVNRFLSVPKDYRNLNVTAYLAGIVHGVLEAAEFTPEKVTAHSVNVEGPCPRTVILIKFRADVISREAEM
mmetsp:Transcript_24148/g.33114  ORF Transcript_24148/g.33114 Transcript_24148/m.33114 type:complete len:192 (+) Transcript_24148:622-1197(+)